MKRHLKIILIIASVLLAVSLVTGILAVTLFGDEKGPVDTLGYGQVGDPADLTSGEKIAGYANVLDYGATPDDNTDDTAAFEAAIKKNIGVYVPAGVYKVSRPLPFNNQNFFGDGSKATQIISTMTDKTKPILYLGGSSTLYDMTLGYDSALVDGSEQQGQRVAVMCGAAIAFGPGGGIKDVTISHVGTAVRSDASDGFGTTNCGFNRISIENSTYCGFDFNCDAGLGSIFNQITATGCKGQGIFTFTGSGGTDSLKGVTIEGCKLKYAVGYTELAGVTAEEPACIDCELSDDALYLIEEE